MIFILWYNLWHKTGAALYLIYLAEDGALSFAYDGQYTEVSKPAVSISMPLQEQSYDDTQVRAFISGLLPDDIVRHRLAKYLGVSEKNSFSLLEAIKGYQSHPE